MRRRFVLGALCECSKVTMDRPAGTYAVVIEVVGEREDVAVLCLFQSLAEAKVVSKELAKAGAGTGIGGEISEEVRVAMSR